MKYALINTMSAVQGDSIGAVVSIHKTYEAAEKADNKLQRMTRKANGSSSYLPTRIVRLTRRPKHHLIANDEWDQDDNASDALDTSDDSCAECYAKNGGCAR